MDFQIAWRNIWRYPRRTSVILTAVVMGVWSMIFLGALMRGIIVGMIHNGINTLTGHILIHQSRYPDDPSIDNSIADGNEVLREIEALLPAG
jgi:ABC-type lipoprotein release transport system permease subunit